MRKVLLGAALAFLVLSLVGGYGLHGKWTGFSENGSVWDWLNLCLLPIAVAFVPLAFEFSTRALVAIAGTFAVALVVLIVGGYGFGWTWTGFPGNTLWDWLHLLLVPVALPFVAHELGERQKTAARGGRGAAFTGGRDRTCAARRIGGNVQPRRPRMSD